MSIISSHNGVIQFHSTLWSVAIRTTVRMAGQLLLRTRHSLNYLPDVKSR
ncbi:hypothetical protein [Spirosoma horti]